MDWLELQKATQRKLDQVSPSFCLAKWLQVTLHLQTGFTHSCHHPIPHKIPLKEIKNDCGALHNTCFKKALRKQMLEGSFPEECRYCWDVENSSTDRFSDRVIKSSDEWASQYFDNVLSCGAGGNIAPTYLEVSFGFNCNLGCIYCSPDVSSTIWKDFEKHGSYPTVFPENELEALEAMGKKPYGIDEANPYVEAFWEWFPSIKDGLRVFRITGGEPLLNQNTFKMLDFINENPMPQISLSINSNLMVPKRVIDDLIVRVNKLVDLAKIKDFTLYTSVDSGGKAAEFIRWGLDYSLLKSNIERYLGKTTLPVTIMVTYSIFSATSSFIEFLSDYLTLKRQSIQAHGDDSNRLVLDISYLHQPQYLSVQNLDEKTKQNIKLQLDFMKQNHANIVGDHGFTDYEINKLERVYNIASINVLDEELRMANRYSFKLLVDEYGKRKKISFSEVFPELTNCLVALLDLSENKKLSHFFGATSFENCFNGTGPLALNLSFSNQGEMACCDYLADESSVVYKYKHDEKLKRFWNHLVRHSDRVKKIHLSGGEPLLDESIFKLLDLMLQGLVRLDLFVLESSLMVEDEILLGIWRRILFLLESKKLGDFKLITRIDSYGQQAEYIRPGLDFNKWKREVERYLELFQTKICFKVMYSIFSGGNGFRQLIDYYSLLRGQDKTERVEIEICRSYRRRYLDFLYADKELVQRIKKQLTGTIAYYQHAGEELTSPLRAILVEIEKASCLSNKDIVLIRHEFFNFIKIHDRRSRMNFRDTFPELSFHLNLCDHRHIIFRAQTGYSHWSHHPDVLSDKIGWTLRTNAATLEEFKYEGEYSQYFYPIEDWDEFLNQSGSLSIDVSLNNICQFNCLYCTADESSSIHREKLITGGVKLLDWRDELYVLRKVGKEIINEPDVSPFNRVVHSGRLREICFGGGEPLQYSGLQKIIKNALDLNKNLDLIVINTSLGLKENAIILNELNKWSNLIRIDSSMDLAGDAGEYVRAGVKYKVWLENVRTIMMTLQLRLRVIVNYTLFSTGCSLLRLVDDVIQMREQYNAKGRVEIVFRHIYKPRYLCIRNYDKQLMGRMEQQLKHFNNHPGLLFDEVKRFEDLVKIAKNNVYSDLEKQVNCINFVQFISPKESQFLTVFPELREYYERGKEMYKGITKSSV